MLDDVCAKVCVLNVQELVMSACDSVYKNWWCQCVNQCIRTGDVSVLFSVQELVISACDSVYKNWLSQCVLQCTRTGDISV